MAILLASFLWGTTGTAASFAPLASPMAIGAFAMGIGGLLQALLAYRHLWHDWPGLRANPALVLTGALAVAIYPLAFYSSMRFAGVATGTVVTIASAPLLTAVIERLFGNHNPMDRRWFVSLMLGISGILLLAHPGDQEQLPSTDSQHRFGIILGLVAGFTYALYSWIAVRLIQRGVRSQSAMAGLFVPASLILLGSLCLTGNQLFATPTGSAAVWYISLIPMFIGYVLFGYGLRHIDASRATLLTLFEPVVAAFMAVFVVGETITWYGWLGAGLIGVCLLIQTQKA
ncbi:DMT family transporter [Parathalassolituus penaei]|uniref:EamA family transporter n=1 Tax=Parathalassolituus penaei TaxID=2997323 RepID=A0A9X3ITX4_9GAMM|nr:EamA family transporter [Parathalassolituus penaei]MCY0966770.1 EamA family transporter [Parathalassolituus penaei]